MSLFVLVMVEVVVNVVSEVFWILVVFVVLINLVVCLKLMFLLCFLRGVLNVGV